MLQVKELQKIFRVGGNEVAALGGVTQGVEEGEFFVLLGPSGSGKTTLLRCVAGLETPDGGEIESDGTTVFAGNQGISAPPEDRKIGMVFQSYAIWPHMTVFQNGYHPKASIQHGIADPMHWELISKMPWVGPCASHGIFRWRP